MNTSLDSKLKEVIIESIAVMMAFEIYRYILIDDFDYKDDFYFHTCYVRDIWCYLTYICCCCSVSKSSSLFTSPWMQHTRLPCPSVSPGVCSNSCPLYW